jgi:chitodextrinase
MLPKYSKLLTAACLAAAVTTLLAYGAPAAPAVTPVEFIAIADSATDASRPSATFGGDTTLKIDGSPVRVIYLKFNISGLPTPPSAALKVYVTSDNDSPFEVRKVADTSWDEATLNASNAPPVGDVVASSGPVTGGQWYTLDVSSAVTGDGVVSLALTTAGSKSTTIHSREGTNKPRILIPAPPGPSPYVITRAGTIYSAVSSSNGNTYSGTLKSVVENAVADLNRTGGGVVHFTAGLFELGDSHFELQDMVNITFEGEGMHVTTITNFRSISSDTEVFDVSRATGGGIRDLTVSAGGPARSTSDAIDYDSGNNQLIERVQVTASRGRGIVFDGKDITGGIVRHAEGNVVHDCVITNVPSDGIELLAASNNRIEGCNITNVGGHGIQITKASASASQPHKKSNANVIIGNFVDQSAFDGVNITSGDGNEIRGNTIKNSSHSASGRDGIRLLSADSQTCNDTVVTGNTATDDQTTKTQRYGLAITSSLCARTVVSGNNFSGNKSGDILDQGTGTIYGDPPPADMEAPTVPTNLAATAVSATQVDLTWTHSTDNVAVTGYTIYRDGTQIATIGSATASYQDKSASPSTSYTYTVDAFDGATNRSTQSLPALATTPAAPPGPSTATFTASEDSYVSDASPSSNFGTQSTVKIDASPVIRSYLKFTVTGLTGAVASAKLRVFATSSSSTGYEARAATSNSWSETGINFSNAPTFGGVVASSGSFTSGAYIETNVTPVITGNGTYTLVMTGPGSTAVSFGSRESANAPQLVVTIEGEPPPPDTEAPSVPTDVSATAISPTRVDLAWTASSDNVGVTGYTIYRDGSVLATVGSASTTYSDTNASPSTTYSYTVDAFDAAANHSAPSAAASATTPAAPAGPSTATFTASEDSYVSESSPSSNFGTQSTLRIDGSPLIRSYLKFTVTGLTGTVTSAKLRVFAASSSNSGYEARSSTDNSWTETGINFSNAPAFGSVIASSGSFASGAYIEVTVTPLITGNGTYTIVLTGPGSTAVSFASRESSNAPQLVVETTT